MSNFCTNCGITLDLENDVYCLSCGEKIDKKRYTQTNSISVSKSDQYTYGALNERKKSDIVYNNEYNLNRIKRELVIVQFLNIHFVILSIGIIISAVLVGYSRFTFIAISLGTFIFHLIFFYDLNNLAQKKKTILPNENVLKILLMVVFSYQGFSLVFAILFSLGIRFDILLSQYLSPVNFSNFIAWVTYALGTDLYYIFATEPINLIIYIVTIGLIIVALQKIIFTFNNLAIISE